MLLSAFVPWFLPCAVGVGADAKFLLPGASLLGGMSEALGHQLSLTDSLSCLLESECCCHFAMRKGVLSL